jgi:hypothetical protein
MLYLDIIKNTMEKKTLNGLSERHVAQIIRRKMIQRCKPSAKTYKREKYKYGEE